MTPHSWSTSENLLHRGEQTVATGSVVAALSWIPRRRRSRHAPLATRNTGCGSNTLAMAMNLICGPVVRRVKSIEV